MKFRQLYLILYLVAVFVCGHLNYASAADNFAALDAAAGDVAKASQAARDLQARDDLNLLDVLDAMQGKSPVAKNWYLSIAQSIADRNPQQSSQILQQFLPRLSEDPDARYWAFSYLTRGVPEMRDAMLESMLTDPSLDLRYEAVRLRLKRMSEAQGMSKPQQVANYEELLAAARLPSQIQTIASKLEDLDAKVDLGSLFGFLKTWRLVGPFDNTNQSAFDTVYAPEKDYLAGQLSSLTELKSKQYEGKNGEVSWQTTTTDSPTGTVDLGAVYNKEKGAVVYALASFTTEQAMECEVRIGSPNAIKVWVNGELAISREVYHASTQIDQYTAPVKLKSGANSVFVKLCQNEQTEPWAQAFEYQLRLTDSTGLNVLE